MKTFSIPYHTGSREFTVPDANVKAVLTAALHDYAPEAGQEELVRRALASPIGTPRLRDLARGRRKVVLVTSDHTRSVPSRITLPILLEEIRAGSPDADITILIATGLHRPTTTEEQKRMFGEDIVAREKISINNAFDPSAFVHVCRLPSGADFRVNRLAVECDLLLAEGFIEPHFFAGFSGGRKSILPGICAQETVNQNHSFQAIASPRAATGVLTGNPIHEDMVYAARRVNTAFICNVALNSRKEIIAAFAGDLEQAHEAGCDFIRRLSRCEPVRGDIVITSNGGYPLDQNLYQTPKAASTAEACAGDDGVIILCAGCADGIGGEHFESLMLSGSVEEIERRLAAVPPEKTIPEQWCAQIYARILKRHTVIVCSDMLSPDLIRKAHMVPAATPAEALKLAFDIKGADASVVLIPDGVSVMVTK
ncbi:MAG: nickel-dependent lactate racemase [Desulfovibrio sp.]|uniref:nickel-dependent lactate racemase n=1 Tax=Desulfovibrio sp. TaxID=885 RepID=UPI0025C4F2BE|nr:nickel-dependent lactate racemase [Desulfovibrio sp.]MCI7568823.1 nickel-dependent lactate racemase [Desulfovibrio sp.]